MDNSTCSSEQEDAANRCRWFRINWKWCKMGSSGLGIDIRLNPMVSLVSAQIIWGFVPWCIYNQTGDSEFYDGRVEDMDHRYLYLDVHWYPRRLGCKYNSSVLLQIRQHETGKTGWKTWIQRHDLLHHAGAAGIEIGLFYFWVGMFTPVIIAVSTIPAIIPHSNYFNNRDFVKGMWDGAKPRTYSVIAEEYFHCCHVIIRRLNTRLQRKSITPESYRIKRVITQFKNSIILNQFHSVVYIVDRICVRPRKPFQSQLSKLSLH